MLWSRSYQDNRSFANLGITLSGMTLNVVEKFNYLVVTIDSGLSFLAHGEVLISSGRYKLTNLRRLKKFMDFELSLLLYKQIVLPCFEYWDFVVESGPEDLPKEIQTLQNHCLRCCKGIRNPRLISRTALHAECMIKKLSVRRNINLLSLMYKGSLKQDALVC